MNPGLILAIFGWIFILGGAVAYGYFLRQVIKKQETIELKELIKNGIIILGSSIVVVLGLTFLAAGYLNDNITIEYLAENSIVFEPISGVMTYIGIIVFGLFLMSLLTSILYVLYINKGLLDKYRKYVKWTMWGLIPLTILFFLLFEEGIAPYLQYPLANQILISSNGIELVHSNGRASGADEGWSFSIAFYAIFILFGACLVLYICDYQIWKKYGDHGLITSCFFIAFPAGIIGARAWYVIGDWYRFADDPIRALYIWDGGLAIMGGAILGIIAGVSFMIVEKFINERYKKLDYFLIADFIVPTILVAQAIGRTGNFFNNEVHGNAVDIAAWEWLPTFIKTNMQFSSTAKSLVGTGQIYVPLFLVEAIVNLSGYFIIEYGIRHMFGLNKLLKHDYHANGSLAGWYIAWYGATRAILEPMRYSSYNMGDDGNWSIVSAYYMIGIGLFVVLVFIVLKVLKEKGILKLQWDTYNAKMAELENKKEEEETPTND